MLGDIASLHYSEGCHSEKAEKMIYLKMRGSRVRIPAGSHSAKSSRSVTFVSRDSLFKILEKSNYTNIGKLKEVIYSKN